MSQDRIDDCRGNADVSDGPAQREAERQRQPKGTAAIRFLQRLAPNRPWVLTAIVPDGVTLTRTFSNGEDARRCC
jgi:hypothetical protein